MPVLTTPVWRHVTLVSHPYEQQSHHESSGPDLGSPEQALKYYGRPSLAECDSLSRCHDDHSSRIRPEHFVEAPYRSMRDPPPSPAHPMAHIVKRQT